MNVNAVPQTQDTSAAGAVIIEADPAIGANKINARQQVQESSVEEKNTEQSLPVEEMKELAADLNDYMDDLQTDLGFFINEDLSHNSVIVEIKNRKTDELVKQIPSEEIVEIREKMAELTGLLLDKSV